MLDKATFEKARGLVVILFWIIVFTFGVFGNLDGGGVSLGDVSMQESFEVKELGVEGNHVNLEEVLLEEVLSGINEPAVVEGIEKEIYVDLDYPETENEREIEKSLMAVVEVGGGFIRKEVMNLRYPISQEGIVSAIERTERVIEKSDERIVKEVVVESREHFDKEITYSHYFAEEVELRDKIRVIWRDEGEISFEDFDENGNGKIDKISWIIPHLSRQEFEVIVEFGKFNVENLSAIVISVLNSPANISSPSITFGFNVSYYNISQVECELLVNSSGAARRLVNDSLVFKLNLTNGNYGWKFDCYDVVDESVRAGANGSFIVAINYTPSVFLEASSGSIVRGDNVSFSLGVNAPEWGEVSYLRYTLNFGDGSFYESGNFSGVRNLSEIKSKNYSVVGNYSVNFTGYVKYSGGDFEHFASAVRLIVVNNSVVMRDNEGPKIVMIAPADNKVFEFDSKEQKIVFSYNVSDNVRVSNCTFEVFYYNNSMFGQRVISEFKSDIVNGSTISYEYKNFDEGDYSWDVECWDNSSNRGVSNDRDFSVYYVGSSSVESRNRVLSDKNKVVSLEEQSDSDKVISLIDAINDFFVVEAKFSPEQVQAIKDLEIDETLKFYKKKLLQIKLDLEHNIKYIQEGERRDSRRAEILREVNEMARAVPVSFEVYEDRDYFKGGLGADLEEVVLAYVNSKGIVLDKSRVKSMVEKNKGLQNQITVSANVKKVSVKYFDGEKEDFVLVSKKIDFKSKSFDGLVEVIPREVASSSDKVVFVLPSYVLRTEAPIVEVKMSDLGGRSSLVYKIMSEVDLGEVEKTTTLAFKEEIPQDSIGGGITGLVSFVDLGGKSWGFYLSWVFVFLGVLGGGVFSLRKFRVARLKRHKIIKNIFEIIYEAEKLLKVRDIEKARAKYYEAQAIYPKIPEYGRRHVYKKLEKLYVEIDKKDMIMMVRDFVTAAREGRREEALFMYGNIQKLYPRMPKFFREKVFEKINPYLDGLK